MAGDIKTKYPAASTAMTVTNLHSLAASSTWVTGWTSASVNNTSNVYLDYLVSGTFTTHASNRQAGTINVYVYAPLNDTPTWPAIFSAGTAGTEGTCTFSGTAQRDAAVRLVASISADATASAVFTFPETSIAALFGGEMPPYFALAVAHNVASSTNPGLAAAGSAIYYTPKTQQYT